MAENGWTAESEAPEAAAAAAPETAAAPSAAVAEADSAPTPADNLHRAHAPDTELPFTEINGNSQIPSLSRAAMYHNLCLFN